MAPTARWKLPSIRVGRGLSHALIGVVRESQIPLQAGERLDIEGYEHRGAKGVGWGGKTISTSRD